MVMGVPLTRIQRRLGLDDMPKSTFHYHASRIAKANGIELQSPPDESELAFYYTVQQSSTEADRPVSGSDSKTSDIDQPKREVAKKPNDNVPRKMPPKRRKPVRPAEEEPEEKYTGFDPSKWPDIEI